MNTIKDEQESNVLPVTPETKNPSVKGPGETLRLARLQKNLTEEHIAKQMRLSPRIIKAIENDDYNSIQCMAFARGYVRSYARIVDLSGDEIVEKLHSIGFEEPEAKTLMHPSYISTSSSKGEKIIRWVTYLISGILVALVFIWWQNSHNASDLNTEMQTMLPKEEIPSMDAVMEEALMMDTSPDEETDELQIVPEETEQKTVEKK